MRLHLKILTLLLLSIPSFSQKKEKARFDKYYFKSYITDTKDIAISPTKWGKKEWINFAGVGAGTAFLMSQDLDIYKYFKRNQTEFQTKLSKFILEPWGSGMYSIGSMAILYACGLVSGNQKTKKTAMLATKGYIISGLFVQIPKFVINRKRPYHETPSNPFKFIGPFGGNYYKSLPSGHATSIFTVATIVASEYKDKLWVQILSYSIAALSSISRIYDGVHWASDIFIGAAFGFTMGKLISKSNNWGIIVY